jgi:2,3-bisphosphoglycerate-independent phosphoglycerate mutase
VCSSASPLLQGERIKVRGRTVVNPEVKEMPDLEIIKSLINRNSSKIVLLVMDGLGGLPLKPHGKTELETARTPNLDRLAGKGICGLMDPVSPGITPGSGPSHLALFGYDPFKWVIGRGVLEALGIGLELTHRDLAARANFATLDGRGVVTDRRAGRIPTQKNIELCQKLQKEIPGVEDVEVTIRPGKEHRFVVVFRGDDLSGDLTDNDPQKEGNLPRKVEALNAGARRSADIVSTFIDRATSILKDEPVANGILLRGLAKCPMIPSMSDVFGLKPGAIAAYPMYKGLAKLVGMEVLKTGETLGEEIETLKGNFGKYDFFYVHVKKTDSSGEDGDFERKVVAIEEVDRLIPEIEALKPDVFVVTADHSTPALLKGHSWHPVPFLLVSPTARPDGATSFSERACVNGGLGRFPAVNAIPLMLAHALKLSKYGA